MTAKERIERINKLKEDEIKREEEREIKMHCAIEDKLYLIESYYMPKIADLVDVANACLKAKNKIFKDCFCGHRFIADAIDHKLGLLANRSGSRAIINFYGVGIKENGKGCNTTISVTREGDIDIVHKSPSQWDIENKYSILKQFIEEFDMLEAKFYEEVDNLK